MIEYTIYNVHVLAMNYFRCLLIPSELDIIPILVVRCKKFMGPEAVVNFLEMFMDSQKYISLTNTFLSDGIYDILINTLEVTDVMGDLSEFRSYGKKVKDMATLTLPMSIKVVEVVNDVL